MQHVVRNLLFTLEIILIFMATHCHSIHHKILIVECGFNKHWIPCLLKHAITVHNTLVQPH